MPDLTLLDCTFRDGGYYTNWQFDAELAEEYIAVCDRTALDVIELGYVRLGEDPRGSLAQLPGGLQRFLRADSKLRFATMVDAASFAGHEPRRVAHQLQEQLSTCSLPVGTIRVAVHFAKLAAAVPAIRALVDAGFRVCVNLMQIDLATPAAERACSDELAGLEGVEAVYLADSLGSMRPDRVETLVRRFAAATGSPVGFHAHDNQGLALTNSLVAVESGATWIDATMCGMGRGAGNAKTEQLLPLLGDDPPDPELFAFVARRFHPLLDRHRWGASIYYSLAGLRRIHPTYVQELEDKPRGVREKLTVLRYLGEMQATSFRRDLLEEAFVNAHA